MPRAQSMPIPSDEADSPSLRTCHATSKERTMQRAALFAGFDP